MVFDFECNIKTPAIIATTTEELAVSDPIDKTKKRFGDFRTCLYNCEPRALQQQLSELCSEDCDINLAHPLGPVTGPVALYEVGYAPLIDAIGDLERRDYLMVGAVDRGEHWIGCGGYYTGVFETPWLDIPATGQLVTMRYVEFFRFEKSTIVEMRLLWDIPQVMMQARAWPMAPGLGVELHVPGPATQDGILETASDPKRSAASMRLVRDMVDGLGNYASGGAGAMQLERYWHPKMNWYGPAGIGSNRRISGFRNCHQIPFLDAMPDRVARTEAGGYDCFFADGDYVVYCGWPALDATLSGDGWMGIAPSGQKITMASLDIWRCENGLIRENWVMIDLLDVWRQVGVDVLARMRALTRNGI